MITHNIHGATVGVRIYQGANLSELERGHCVGRVVNLLRDTPAADMFAVRDEVVERKAIGQFGGPLTATFLKRLDAALEANYCARYADDYPPIVGLVIDGIEV